ncbi:cytochrome P450 [Zopfochytrium polystomum]|nr:cytochrome P450 [Zopfochytrium polystomum]
MYPACIGTADPRVVEHVLKTRFEMYEKGEFFASRVRDVLGKGIFAVDGEAWRIQRKTMSHMFNVKNFKDFVNVVFAETMTQLTARLDRAAATGATVDLSDLFSRFTLDSFSRVGFGESVGALARDEAIPFMRAFDRAQHHIMVRFNTPLWWAFEWVSRGGWEHGRNVRTIREFGRHIVERRMEAVRRGERAAAAAAAAGDEGADGTSTAGFTDVVGYLIEAVGRETGTAPTAAELAEHVINLVIAGRDTTAQALSWSVVMLARHAKARAELVAEADRAMPDARGGLPSYEAVRGCRYALAVVRETLRLQPSVPYDTKVAVEDDVLPNGVRVARGTMIYWSVYAMGRNPRVWGADAAEFRPERWLEMETLPSPFEYPVFNAGPRTCLGKGMAELQAVFVLVALVRRFEIEVLEPEKVTYDISTTLPIKGGLRVKLRARD